MLPQHDNNQAWTVGELNSFAQRLLTQSTPKALWLCGELGRVSFSGDHLYSTLKDELGNVIKLVYFHGAKAIASLKLAPGACLLAYGHLDLYIHDGSYQFVAAKLLPANTQGELMQRYLETRKKLEAEGLFAPERKRPLPIFPKCIGLITSMNGAAIHDFLTTAYSRVPNLHVRIAPAPMQGPGAAAQIAACVRFLSESGLCDVIVITRGGGSMEDLWEFNDEQLARTIAAATTPIVTAVGHQIDSTMVDFVADCSVITPTQAATAITEQACQVRDYLHQATQRMAAHVQLVLSQFRNRLTRAQSCPYLQRPQDLYTPQAQRLDNARMRLVAVLPQRAQQARQHLTELQRRLPEALKNRFALWQARLKEISRPLSALDPKGVLQRGYSILLDDQKHAVRTPQETHPGQPLTALLAQGQLALTVREPETPRSS